jgi:hypothetical protein
LQQLAKPATKSAKVMTPSYLAGDASG